MTDIIRKELNVDEHVTRTWAALEIKKVDGAGDTRTIKGVASTPTTDRMGDIVEPMGMEFKNPLPLIWQHRHEAAARARDASIRRRQRA